MKQSTWQRFLRQPQQMRFRRISAQVHLWAGLIATLYICAIGVSGSILVYKDELMPRPHVAGPPVLFSACTPATLLRSLAAAQQTHPADAAVVASCPTAAYPLYGITLRSRMESPAQQFTVSVDPRNGRVLGEVNQEASWVGLVDRFHMDLLLRDAGRQWNGVGAAVLLVLVSSGLVLWWPGTRKWTRGFKVDVHGSAKRIVWELHRAVGVWTLVFTLAWAVSGVYFAWPGPFERAIQKISPITTARYPEETIERLGERAPVRSSRPLDLEAVLRQAVASAPKASLEGFYFGSGPAPLLTVYMARGATGDYTRTDFLYFDQQTGAHLFTWHRGQNRTLGDWLLWLVAPLHFGTSFGGAGKLIWAASGLALPVLAITGLLVYWNRWLRKQIGRPAR